MQTNYITLVPIIDLFASLQGEGQYVGRPSVFIRVAGCNLRCCFKDSICDTPYSSFRPEGGKYTAGDVVAILREYPNVKDIVITGGEPMLYQQQLSDLMVYVEEQTGTHYHITVETNGTIAPDTNYALEGMVDLWSISPKLGTSVPVVDHPYQVDKIMTRTFSQKEVDRLNTTRTNIDALVRFMDSAQCQWKFVYSGPDSLKDVDDLLEQVGKVYGSRPFAEDIYLMPEGVTTEQLDRISKEVAQVCMERGYNFTDRLHIRIWGDKRGF